MSNELLFERIEIDGVLESGQLLLSIESSLTEIERLQRIRLSDDLAIETLNSRRQSLLGHRATSLASTDCAQVCLDYSSFEPALRQCRLVLIRHCHCWSRFPGSQR